MPSTTATTVPEAPAKRLFVFDFDWTLIDADSDEFVFKHLNTELHQEQLASAGKVQWTDLQQRLLGELFKCGVTKEDIERTLSQVPFAPEMIEALKLMKSQGSELYILSDANTVYIDTILKAHSIDNLFTKVITNPAAFDEQGRLNVVRFHGLDKKPHNCPLPCQPNLCKGREIQKLIDSQTWDQVIYMGDATNDFCPSTRLQNTDIVLARRGLLLEQEIRKRPYLVKANVLYWDNAQDVLSATHAIFEPCSPALQAPSIKLSDEMLPKVVSTTPNVQVQAVKA
ncbi:putative phosphatase-domain-containing protein [Lobosporangium transversale]|uniref:Putative phosphatase-domain-containing protein n=1 Tax=Lobosporangium transversale TaxID=64571 RepID=A0A1Y2GXA9_9FUNG|nr:putative phosphatase-domain-containing protein [Lobosporangium transversale]ORZ26930.1 putative phosphatase-domain-containing protein [Lobosporangium transversale]|eukprot:XP_021884677.1 putative phosphatase-domain-containing protein [Lobosporangium transversale]